MTVSAIIPVHNGERYLAEAIESVLGQSRPPEQVLVVDDGSTDGTHGVVAQFSRPVEYVLQPHAGAAAARNRGAALAAGEFFAFLDADDVWMAHKLALQLSAFEQDPALEAVFGGLEPFFSPDLAEDARRRIHVPPANTPGNSSCTILIRRESFLRVGPLDENLKAGEFIEWSIRAADAGLRTRMLPDVVTRRRIHRANGGLANVDARTDYLRILKARLDRRRAGGE